MKTGLSTSYFSEGLDLATAVRRVHDLGFDLLALAVPGPVLAGTGAREIVHSAGLSTCAVVVEGGAGASDPDFAESFVAAARQASRLRAERVVADGGPVGGSAIVRALKHEEVGLRDALRRGAPLDVEEIVERRSASRVERAEQAVRVLHAAVRQGAPVAVRNGGRAFDLLGFEETGWVLDELPELMLYFDGARALRLHRLGLGPLPEAWAEAYGRRTFALVLQGLGSDLAGGSHPEDVAPDWGRLAEALPRAVPGVFDLAPSLATADVEDALRYVRSVTR